MAPDIRRERCFVYGLIDPRDGAIRYVGKSVSPIHRLYGHANSPNSPGMRDWLLELEIAGLTPGLKILCTVPPGENVSIYESYFIGLLSRTGTPLNRQCVDRVRQSATPRVYQRRLRHCRHCRSTQHEGPRCPTELRKSGAT